MKIARLGAVLLVLGLFASACVRLTEPGLFYCNSDRDCSSDERCAGKEDVDGKTCRPRDSCDSYAPCDDDHVCTDGKCLPVECDYEDLSGCPAGYACVRARCNPHCSEDADCGYTARCESNGCVEGRRLLPIGVDCSENADCASHVCCTRSDGGKCAQSCGKVGASCTTTANCLVGSCCTQSNGDKICTGLACSVAECQSDGDCPVTQTCNAKHQCEQPAAMVGKANGSPCTKGSDCTSASCISGACHGLGVDGAACQSSLDCKVDWQCCSGTCADKAKACPGTLGASCLVNSDCQGGFCYDEAFCTKDCQKSSNCGDGPQGNANVCDINPLSDGAMCFLTCEGQADCDEQIPGTECVPGVTTAASICDTP